MREIRHLAVKQGSQRNIAEEVENHSGASYEATDGEAEVLELQDNKPVVAEVQKETSLDLLQIETEKITGRPLPALIAHAISHSEPWAKVVLKLSGLAIILYSKPSGELIKLVIAWLKMAE